MESSLTEKLETTIVKFKEELEMIVKDFGKPEGNTLVFIAKLISLFSFDTLAYNTSPIMTWLFVNKA